MYLPLQLKNRIKRSPTFAPLMKLVRDRRMANNIRRMRNRPLPESVNIELTNDCNLKCAKCPTYDAKRGRGYLSETLYKKIIADIAAHRCPVELGLSGGGEAIIHPQIVDFVRWASQIPNINRLGFATNGLALTPELSAQVLEAGVNRIKFSFDAVDAKTYLKFNRVDGFDECVTNFKEFCRLKKAGNYNCEVTLKVTLYKEDVALMNRMKEMFADHVDLIRATRLHNWGGLRGGRKGNERSEPCNLLWHQVQILWDGQITLCCYDSMEGFFNMGNIEHEDLSHYWHRNMELAAIRNQHLERDFSKLPVCATCNTDNYETLELHYS